MSVLIAPSVLASDMLHLEDEMKRTERSGADMIHLDVMDGVYVPNISFGFDVIRAIRSVTDLPLDVHMMTVCPEKYLEKLKSIGADSVTIHHDNRQGHVIDTIKEIHALGMKCGIAISPKIDATAIFSYLKEVDMVLVMSVEPGFGGQKFRPECSAKIPQIKKEMERIGKCVPVQIDGGINLETAQVAIKDGADILVVGTASYGSKDMRKTIEELKTTNANA